MKSKLINVITILFTFYACNVFAGTDRALPVKMNINPPANIAANANDPDSVITHKIEHKILRTKSLAGESINVATHDGIVTIEGSVESKKQAQRVVRIAKNTKNVKEVRNHLTVRYRTTENKIKHQEIL